LATKEGSGEKVMDTYSDNLKGNQKNSDKNENIGNVVTLKDCTNEEFGRILYQIIIRESSNADECKKRFI
jgi:hypothetical protein